MVQDSGYPPPPQYGPPSYGPPPRKSRGPLVLIGALVVVLVVVLAIGAVVLLKDSSDDVGAKKTRPSAPQAVEFRRVTKAESGTCDTATPAPTGVACGKDGTRYTLGKVELDGSNISSVKAMSRAETGWYVALSLDDQGRTLFGNLTTDLAKRTPPQNQLAIVVRGKVISAPTVMSPITAGEVEISSSFSQQDAENLAAEITG